MTFLTKSHWFQSFLYKFLQLDIVIYIKLYLYMVEKDILSNYFLLIAAMFDNRIL